MSVLSSLITAIYGGGAPKVYPQYVSMLLNGDSAKLLGNLPFTYNAVASPTSEPLQQLNNVRNDPFNPFQGDGNYGVQFNGTTEYLTTGTHSSLEMGTDDFTIEFWLNLTTQPAALTRVFSLNKTTVATAADEGIAIEISAANILTFSAFSGTTQYAVNSLSTVRSSEWEHWAACRSGGTLMLYRNGVAQNAGTAIGAASVNGGALFRAIAGSWTGAARFLRGMLSNLRVVKGTALYSADFVVPAAGLTAVAGTSLLTCCSKTVKDLSTNAHALTLTGTPSVTYVNPLPTAVALARPYAGSVEFNGTNAYYSVGYNSSLSFTGDFTYEMFIKPSNATYGVLAGSTGNGFLINRNGDGSVSVFHSGTGTTLSSVVGAAPVDKWTHVAWTRSGDTACLWVNGFLAASGSQPAGTYTLGLTTGASLYIGARADTTNKFTGVISNLRAVKGEAKYVGPFVPMDVPAENVAGTSLLTLQGDSTDRSSNPLTLTVYGNPVFKQSSTPFNKIVYSDPVTGGVQLSGIANNCVNFPLSYNSSIGALAGHRTTIEFWINTQNTQTVSAMDLFGNTRTGTVNGKYSVTLSAASSTAPQKIAFFYSTSTSGGNTLNTTAILPIKQWHHVAVDINAVTPANSTVTIYLNGVGQTFAAQDLSTHTADPGLTFGLGYIAGVQAGFSGYLSNFRIVRDSPVYTTDFTPVESELTAVPGTVVLTFQKQAPVSNFGIVDSSGLNKLTAYGQASQGSYNPSRAGWSVKFASGSSVYTDIQPEFNSAQGDWSIEGWYMFTTLAFQGQELFRFEGGGTNYNPYFTVWDNGTIMFRAAQTGVNIVTPFAHGMVVNNWYHWAVTKVGNSFTVYKDGNVVTSGSYSGLISENKRIRIGVGFSGYASNVRFVNVTPAYTAAFVPPRYSLEATENTQLLMFKNAELSDYSDNAFTLNKSGDVTARHLGPVSPEKFVAYDPTIEGGSVYYAGTSSDYVNTFASSQWIFKGDYTQEAWVYPCTGGTTTDMTIFATGSSYAANDNFSITPGVGNAIITHCHTAIGSLHLTQTATIPFNAWTHVAVSRSGSTLRAFVNGVQVYSGNVTGSIGTNGLAFIGKRGDNTAMFKGYMANLCISNECKYTSEFLPLDTVLSTTTSTVLLLTGTNGGSIDQTTSLNLRPVGNVAVSTTVKKYGSTALYFGATSCYFKVPADAISKLAFGTDDFTMEMWIYKTVASTNHGLIKLGTGATNLVWYIHQFGTITAAVNNGSTTLAQSTTITVPVNEWVHVALSREGSTLRMFINGVVCASVSNSTAFTVDPDGCTVLGLNTTNFVGYADDVRITRGHALYTANFTPPTETLPS